MNLLFFSLKDKIKAIVEATYTHSRNLALFVFAFKGLTSTLSWGESKSHQLHAFLSAFCAGFVIFGKYNKVNEQVCNHLFKIKSLLFSYYNNFFFKQNSVWHQLILYCVVVKQFLLSDQPLPIIKGNIWLSKTASPEENSSRAPNQYIPLVCCYYVGNNSMVI